MLRLLKYNLVIIFIMFVILMYALHMVQSIHKKTNTDLLRMGNIQTIVQRVTEMSTCMENFYNTPDERYYNEFNQLYGEAIGLADSVYEESKGIYVYRDLRAILTSYYEDGEKFFENRRNNSQRIYSRDLLTQQNRLKDFILSESYRAIGQEIFRAQNYSSAFFSNIRTTTILIYLLVIGVTLLCVLIAWRVSTIIAEPIHSLGEKLRRVGSGDLTVREHESSTDEIQMLVDSFNNMVLELRSSQEENRQKSLVELQLREEKLKNIHIQNLLNRSELELLRMQINPHFLFNTFNSISALAQIENAEQTRAMVDSLSTILRYSLSKMHDMIPLREECTMLQSYLFIQKTRFGDRLQYEIDISPRFTDRAVPSMILQPIVENAIIHGLEPQEDGGQLFIDAFDEDGVLVLCVSDDGAGMDEDKLRELASIDNEEGCNTSHGIGLRNVRRRLSLIYGHDVMEIQSTPGHGTVIYIRIPTKS